MRKILLVWQEIPDETKFYAITVDDQMFDNFRTVQAMYMNGDDFDEEQQKAWDSINELLVSLVPLDLDKEHNISGAEFLFTTGIMI